jgi:hypothetical protein
MDPEFQTIEELQSFSLWPLKFLPAWGMVPYIKRMGKNIKGIELGVLKGETSHILLSECQNIKKLKGVDPYLAYVNFPYNAEDRKTQEDMNKYFEIMKKNMKRFPERWTHIKKSSEEAISMFAKESYDFILLDTIQDREQIHVNLSLYYPILKKGGIMFCHDFHLEEVREGIKLFANSSRVREPINRSKNEIAFWRKS